MLPYLEWKFRIRLSPEKTVAMLFTRNQEVPEPPTLTLEDRELLYVGQENCIDKMSCPTFVSHFYIHQSAEHISLQLTNQRAQKSLNKLNH